MDNMKIETKFLVQGRDGRTYRKPVTLEKKDGRIWFVKSPFELKDEIKTMRGSHWHGFDDPPIKQWSVEDCQRNEFQIRWLQGENPYEWYDQPLKNFTYPQFGSERFGFYDLMGQQKLMADMGLTYHYHIWGAEMGTGKTLAAFAVATMSGLKNWWWVGPKSSLYEIRLQLEDWGIDPSIFTQIVHYEKLVKMMGTWQPGEPAPYGLIIDELHRCKTPGTHRYRAVDAIAKAIRAEHGMSGYVIGMTGTPSPKNPGDWWGPCEIVYPGFIKEGTRNAFIQRMSFLRLDDSLSGQNFNVRTAWKDDTERCAVCGKYDYNRWVEKNGQPTAEDWEAGIEKQFGNHDFEQSFDEEFERHDWKESINEVLLVAERLKGLVTIIHKKDWIELPEKTFKIIHVEPSPSTLRVAKAIAKSAPNAMTAMHLLRELSDGFQYRDIEEGTRKCDVCTDGTETVYVHPTDPDASYTSRDLLDPDFANMLEEVQKPCSKCHGSGQIPKTRRIIKEVPTPKDAVVRDILEDQEDQGRVVFFAAFKGTLDRLVKMAQKEGWDTIRADGDGWVIKKHGVDQKIKLENPMTYWINPENRKVAFIAQPMTGGISLTLCEQKGKPGAQVACFFSNDFNPASRSQAVDRIHRTGMLGTATIIDIIHLPSDARALSILNQNRKLELMTMGEVLEDYSEVD